MSAGCIRFVDSNFIFSLHLPSSAWVLENWAEKAWKMGRIAELMNRSTNQNLVLNHHGVGMKQRESLHGADLSDKVRRICCFLTSTSQWPVLVDVALFCNNSKTNTRKAHGKWKWEDNRSSEPHHLNRLHLLWAIDTYIFLKLADRGVHPREEIYDQCEQKESECYDNDFVAWELHCGASHEDWSMNVEVVLQGWAKEMELSWEKVSARLQPATAGHARLVPRKTVPFFYTTLYSMLLKL